MPSSNSWFARHREGAWYSLVIVALAAVVCGGVVAGVNYAGHDAFAAADLRLDEAKGGAQRALLFPDASSFEQVSAPAIEGLNSVYKTNDGAWIFDCSVTGYHGDVELMVGINADGTIAGIQVVAEDETDGIGTNALTDEYLGSFAGLEAAGSVTTEEASGDATHVDGVSGATFTTNAVIGCVNIALEAYAQLGGN